MAILSKSQILAAVDLPTETVAVPEWGGEVLVRGLTAAERDTFEQSVVTLNGAGKAASTKMNLSNIRAKLCSLTIVDENGERLFSDAEVDVLGQKSAQALQRVFDAAQRLSGLSQSDVEELAKN